MERENGRRQDNERGRLAGRSRRALLAAGLGAFAALLAAAAEASYPLGITGQSRRVSRRTARRTSRRRSVYDDVYD